MEMPGRKIIEFIGKDTSDQNESKRLLVILRVLSLSVAFYFLIHMIGSVTAMGSLSLFACLCLFFMGYTGLFCLSYHMKTGHILWGFQTLTILSIFALVCWLGWDIGVQQFFMVMLILSFFSGYAHCGRKIVFAVFILLVRVCSFYVYRQHIPTWKLPGYLENILQIINTFAVFWCISVVAFFFSRDSQELEGKLIAYNNELEKQAATDTLTRLYNRRWAGEHLDEMVGRPEIYGSFCICIGDIDFFKKVNDNYGHDFGDEVLRRIAAVLKAEMAAENGFVARWGGEEFLLVYIGCNGDEARVKLENLRRKIKELKVEKDDQQIGVTMTFGLAEYDFFNGLEKTLKDADQKLYMGKQNGRDMIMF